ncbi:nucleoside-diphosphate-sugar epimerase [Dongia mobilis]|uniref:Nucleoside-diphosphate-sugar epimerase n=1 Tax=Dongia mobilis TaxID=578943 RepID=A0A4R6WLM4_9PROT|nr:SDR family NAD(P)-dependent oxidoreductase [Dongia mobilis]TDQ81466.1 nucleoside-diphosphate-sugar epimerase [Dongia mobilis]
MRGIVAVTGATGFVGAALTARLLAEGWRVRILTRRLPQAVLGPDRHVEIVLGDLDDRDALHRLVSGATAIIHCAGVVKALSPAEFATVNAGGTECLLAEAAREPAARLIHISSLAARAPHLSPYAASKRAAEEMVEARAGQRDWVILRPPAIYGPGDRELLPLFQAAKLGLVTYPAARNARVSVVHVTDLAAAIAALLDTPAWQERLIEIDDGAPAGHDWVGILSALAGACGRSPVGIRVPRPLFLPIAAAASLRASLIRRPMVLSLAKVAELYHPDWVAGGPRLTEMVNWQPAFGLAEGFRDTAAWYRRHSLL